MTNIVPCFKPYLKFLKLTLMSLVKTKHIFWVNQLLAINLTTAAYWNSFLGPKINEPNHKYLNLRSVIAYSTELIVLCIDLFFYKMPSEVMNN